MSPMPESVGQTPETDAQRFSRLVSLEAVLIAGVWVALGITERLPSGTLNNTVVYIDADGEVRLVHFGSLFRFQVKGDWELLYYRLLCKGLYVWEGRNCFLSTAHTDEDVDLIIGPMAESGKEPSTTQEERPMAQYLLSVHYVDDKGATATKTATRPCRSPCTGPLRRSWPAPRPCASRRAS